MSYGEPGAVEVSAIPVGAHTALRAPAAPAFAPVPPVFYPAPRARPGESSGRVGDKYERYQVVSGAAGTLGALREIGRFSGTPDAIDVLAVGGDALVQFQDQLGQGGSSFRLVAGTTLQTQLSYRMVVAANVIDAAQATIFATGKWANPREAVNGTQQYEDKTENLKQTGTDDPAPFRPAQPY